MGLHETDKSGDRRLKPAINANDPVLQRPAHKTLSTSFKSASEPLKQRLVFNQNSVEGYDSANRKNLFIGYDPEISENPVVRIAKPEKDAFSEDNADFIFNSEQNVFKIVGSDTYFDNTTRTQGSPGAGNFGITDFSVATIPHLLGYVPAIIAYYRVGTRYILMPYTDYFTGGGSSASWFTFSVSADASNVYIKLNLMTFGGSSFVTGASVKYYLLQETAS